MRIAVLVFALVTWMLVSAPAGEHLEPERGLFTEYDRYHNNVRKYFDAAQQEKVLCQVTIIASFQPEEFIGIHKTEKGHEVFSIKPASAIWDFESIRMRESGQIGAIDKDGKAIPLEQDETYQKLKKRVPADFRQIKSEVKAAAIDDALAGRIAKVWERMILGTRYPKRPGGGFDGARYHFSMWVSGYGLINGQTWSPDEKTKAGELVDLAYALADYSRKGMDAVKLKKIVERVEKAAKS